MLPPYLLIFFYDFDSDTLRWTYTLLSFLCMLANQKNNTTLLRIQIQRCWVTRVACVCVNMCRKKGIRLLLASMFVHSKARLFISGCCCLFVSVRKFNYPMLKFNYLMRVCVVTKILFHFFHNNLKDFPQFFLAFRHQIN